MHQRYSKFKNHQAYVERVKALLEQDQAAAREDQDLPGLALALTGLSLYDPSEDTCWLEYEAEFGDGTPDMRDMWVSFDEEYLYVPGSDLEHYYDGILELYQSICDAEGKNQ